VDAAKKAIAGLPSEILVDYMIGTKELDRVPQEDVHLVNGIKCYLSDDQVEAIGAREIVLDNGVLRFEPKLDAFKIQRS